MDRATNGKVRIHTCIHVSVICLRKNLGYLYRQEGSWEDGKENRRENLNVLCFMLFGFQTKLMCYLFKK